DSSSCSPGRTLPAASTAIGSVLPGEHDDESRQVFTFATDAVSQPGAQTRIAGNLASCAHEQLRGRVVELRGLHRADNRDVVDDRRQMGKQIRELRAAPTVPGKVVWRAEELWITLEEREPLALNQVRGTHLAVVLVEFRFVVEQVQLRRPARHEQKD